MHYFVFARSLFIRFLKIIFMIGDQCLQKSQITYCKFFLQFQWSGQCWHCSSNYTLSLWPPLIQPKRGKLSNFFRLQRITAPVAVPGFDAKSSFLHRKVWNVRYFFPNKGEGHACTPSSMLGPLRKNVKFFGPLSQSAEI